MSEAPSGEKSHEATPERLKKARGRGDVPVSPEVAVLASYAGLLLGLTMAGGAAMALAEALCGAFTRPESFAGAVLTGEGHSSGGVGMGRAGLLAVGVLIGPASVLVALGIGVQGGFVFAPTKLKPELKKLNPAENAKKKYGASGLGEFARGSVKVLAAAGLGAAYLWARRDGYLGLVGAEPGALPGLLRAELAAVLGLGCLVALGVAVIDVPVRRLRHRTRLRMSRQEVQDEGKEQEGDQNHKRSRRQRGAEIARNRMLQDVGTASVVITNPTHYAVALRWDRAFDTVPVCVAKGTDDLALVIKDRARAAGVPMREDRTTARALHASVEVGGHIAPEHYAAVAAAIRYAERVSRS